MSNVEKPLTKRQTEVLLFIKSFIAENHYPPTQAEIAGHFGICQNAAKDFLKALAKKNEIKLVKGISRGIVIVGEDAAA